MLHLLNLVFIGLRPGQRTQTRAQDIICPVSYTHLDVYKRQPGSVYKVLVWCVRLTPVVTLMVVANEVRSVVTIISTT